MTESATGNGTELILWHDALQALVNGGQRALFIVGGQEPLPGVDAHLVGIFIHLGIAGNILYSLSDRYGFSAIWVQQITSHYSA